MILQIDPELWRLVEILVGGYAVFILNKTDRSQRELFRRLRAVELVCAANHGIKLGGTADENC